MAKVKFGTMVTDARGKQNGVVFTRGPFGAVARAKVSPVQPRGNRQSLVRERTASLAKRWAGILTQVQRDAWSAFAQTISARNVFGDSLILSGIQAYVRLNNLLLNAGASIIDTPPADLGITGLSSINATAAAGTPAFSIAFTPTPLDTNVALYVSASPQMSPGRTFGQSLLRFIAASAGAAASPFNALNAYTGKFGSLIAGKHILVKVQAIDKVKGSITPGITQLITVAA
jgi:hypothetical protein